MDPIHKVASLAPTKKAFSLFEEFKNFAFKGNVIDLAVGVIIGAAFGKIIDSLVKHIIMPLVGVLLPGKQGYLDWKWVIQGQGGPLRPVPGRGRQLPDRGAGAVPLHRQVPRLGHEGQEGGGGRPAAPDQGPGVVGGDPRPAGKGNGRDPRSPEHAVALRCGRRCSPSGKEEAARFFGLRNGSRERRLGPKLAHELSPLSPYLPGTCGQVKYSIWCPQKLPCPRKWPGTGGESLGYGYLAAVYSLSAFGVRQSIPDQPARRAGTPRELNLPLLQSAG